MKLTHTYSISAGGETRLNIDRQEDDNIHPEVLRTIHRAGQVRLGHLRLLQFRLKDAVERTGL